MNERKQRGFALVILLAMLAVGASWFMVSQLDAITADVTAARRNDNAAVLAEAKQAVIGYMAIQAARDTENQPGTLPCPEAAADAGGAAEGLAATSQGLPIIGRLPWKSLGVDQLRDAASEPLWYVVADGWTKCGTSGAAVINSNCASSTSGMTCWSNQLTVAGQQKAAIALIIAPGAAMPGQARSAPAAGIDFANYIECYLTAAPGSFSRPACTSNDQVLAITSDDVLPVLESVIAKRIEKQIVPALNSTYAGGTWGITGTNPLYPYPALFANPGTRSSYQGSAVSCDITSNVCKGLLPVIFTNEPGSTTTLCTPGGSSLCDPMYVNWASGTVQVKQITLTVLGSPITLTPSPFVISGTSLVWNPTGTDCAPKVDPGPPQYSRLECDVYIPGLAGILTTNVTYEIKAVAANVGMALRAFNASAALSGVTPTSSPTVTMDLSGSATVTISGSIATAPSGSNLVSTALCGLSGLLPGFTLECRKVSVQIPLPPLFPDAQLLDSSDSSLGWFTRNEWYRLTYYAVARGHTPAILPAAPSCLSGTDCITVANATPSNGQRAILILAGKSINGGTRPDSPLSDYLEFGNATANFEIQPVRRMATTSLKAPFNDRIISVGTN